MMSNTSNLIGIIAKVIITASGAFTGFADIAQAGIGWLGSKVERTSFSKAYNSLQKNIADILRANNDRMALNEPCIAEITSTLFNIESACKLHTAKEPEKHLLEEFRRILSAHRVPYEEQKIDLNTYIDWFLSSVHKTIRENNELRDIQEMYDEEKTRAILERIGKEQERTAALLKDGFDKIEDSLDPPRKRFHDYIRTQHITLEDLLKETRPGNMFHYRSVDIGLWGREAELQQLNRFLYCKDKFKIMTITGSGGSGKSKLAFEFCKSLLGLQGFNWSIINLDWEGYRQQNLHENPYFEHPKNLLIIIDYILVNAADIGKWLKSISDNHRNIHEDCVIRVIITERNHYSPDTVPLWYDQAIRKYNLEGCLHTEKVELAPLSDEDLISLAGQYIRTCWQTEDQMIRTHIIQPLRREIDPDLRRPLFVLYMAQAFIDHNGNIRHWNRDALLEQIEKNETKRIRNLMMTTLMKKDDDPSLEADVESLENLLTYATAAGGLTAETLPSFLEPDWTHLKNIKGKTLKDIFNAVNLNYTRRPELLPLMPDLLTVPPLIR